MSRLHIARHGVLLVAIFVIPLLPVAAEAQTLITTDSLLNTGSPLKITYDAPGSGGPVGTVNSSKNASQTLWLIYPNPWGVSSGNGTIEMNYTGAGALVTSVSLSGLPGGPVDAYPFLLYGCDPYSDCYNGQPPQFPKQLSSMSSLVVDFKYALTGTIAGAGLNLDVLFDEWVCNSNHPTNTPQCLEVEILPYYNFPSDGPSSGGGASFVKTINEPVTLNGAASTFSFDEYIWGQTVLFVPSNGALGLSSGEIRFNMLDLLTSAVAAYGNNNFSWLAGLELGTEFGGNSTQTYTLTLNKLDLEQTLGAGTSAPAPPTNLNAVVK